MEINGSTTGIHRLNSMQFKVVIQPAAGRNTKRQGTYRHTYRLEQTTQCFHQGLASRFEGLSMFVQTFEFELHLPTQDTHYRNQFETGTTSGSSDMSKRKVLSVG